MISVVIIHNTIVYLHNYVNEGPIALFPALNSSAVLTYTCTVLSPSHLSPPPSPLVRMVAQLSCWQLRKDTQRQLRSSSEREQMSMYRTR